MTELADHTALADEARADLLARLDSGARFAGLVGDGDTASGVTLHALLSQKSTVDIHDLVLPPGRGRYPALTPQIPGAFWYERKLHDLHGLIPDGHPRLDPLVLPHRASQSPLPSPGAVVHPERVQPDERAWPPHVAGSGVFTIPHGPVRSGVFESVEYVVETPGEDIPHVNVRPFAKHRGVEVRFEDLDTSEGVLLAERVEGIASVAHALAYAHAVEALAGVQPPRAAGLVRVIHAELERIANHLDVAMKLADAAGLAVAVARFGWHKERLLRLRSKLCGNRFGRGVVIVGGVPALPRLSPSGILAEADRLQGDIIADARELMGTASFLDRLRGAGPLDPGIAREHGILGPVGRACGLSEDARWQRPYDAYPLLRPEPLPERDDGDAQARLHVRWDEVAQSFSLLRQAVDLLGNTSENVLSIPAGRGGGLAVGWAEAPQGELLYLLRTDPDGRIRRCAPRSASFHNLAVFSRTFNGDILTDFPFIEASFGISIAGVVM